ncbi:PREDICTED: glycine-rich protein A3-like [Nelumbo nucifera]|uniref:Glycine-rich protein A3-like n=2 Tax=Nelumbo nucifera TaxID=4432 RepID=A0A1U8B2Z6_NELNU|nr:PREDICTED: glycine-rich protein A3-like [Nelumbo nucifera]XP_010275145.1 PREDICTED: glycine-rich protein A3-like [Nelumbo nucifera]
MDGGNKEKNNVEIQDKGLFSHYSYGVSGEHYSSSPWACPPVGYPPQGYPSQGYPSAHCYPPQGYPPAGYSASQGPFFPTGYPSSAFPYYTGSGHGMGMGAMLAGGAAAAYGAHHLAHGAHHLVHGHQYESGLYKHHGKFHKHGKYGKPWNNGVYGKYKFMKRWK